MRTIQRAALVAIVLGAASGAMAQTPIDLTISGNQAQGTISLPGDIAADLTITFENSVGLTPTALEAWATLVDPADQDLLVRLPRMTSIPGAFPVLLRIGPAVPSGLRFSSVATVSLHTHNLVFDTASPKALLKAHDGGSFEDVTTSEGIGSYRVGGSTGDFSEFLIVNDSRGGGIITNSLGIDRGSRGINRGSRGTNKAIVEGIDTLDGIDTVIVEKFDALQATFTAYRDDMPFLVATTLQARLTAARLLYLAGGLLGAIDKLTSFESYVVEHTGADIPGVWDGDNPTLINVAGLLRTEAETLKFSLDRKASQ